MAYVVAVLMSALGVAGDYFLRVAGSGPRYISWGPFIVGVLLYALTAIGWFYAFKHMKLAMVGVVYSLSTLILLTLLGTLYFREHLSYVEGIGLLLAIVVIILLARFA